MQAPLLLLHGALGSKAQLKELQDRISGLTIDLSGHGARAIPSEGMNFEQFIDDIDGALSANGWSRAHLFGYSMGGYAALLYAARHPERVLSVATLGTILVWSEEGLQKELRKLDPDLMEAKVPAFTQGLVQVHGVDRWRSVVTAVAESMTVLAAAPLLNDGMIARITCPVLCCVGENDTSAVPGNTKAFAARLPSAEALVLPDTKHPFEDVKLDLLVPQLEKFWSGIR